MADKRKSKYSWKAPWAFNSFHKMRRTLTERYVYKKLGVLERHSSFKKPYRQRSPHKLGELDYSYRDQSGNPGTGGPPPPGFGGCADAPMVCLGGMLDCEQGGCDLIACICGAPPYNVSILSDPTEQAWTEPGFFPKVCVPEGMKLDLEHGEIIARVTDANGQSFVTTHSLVDCAQCCDPFVLGGDDNKDPNSTWTGTITPACEGATVVVTSNSGCTLSGTVASDGATVSVPIGALDCGAFTVTVSFNESGCDVQSASITVRINDTGANGGDWALDTVIWCRVQSGCGGHDCTCAGGDCVGVPHNHAACIDGEYRYGLGNAAPNLCTLLYKEYCSRINAGDNFDCEGKPPCLDTTHYDCTTNCTCPACGGAPAANDWYWDCHRCVWECAC